MNAVIKTTYNGTKISYTNVTKIYKEENNVHIILTKDYRTIKNEWEFNVSCEPFHHVVCDAEIISVN